MPIEQLLITVPPPGKGLDPNRSGYQIAACSETLPASARGQLEAICAHYGQAVYSYRLKARKQLEEWQSANSNGAEIPETILREFPVVWCYDRLGTDLYGLTRVQFLGWDFSSPFRRLGNFIAHALVFTSVDLAAQPGNPLALSRVKGLFATQFNPDGAGLAALADFGAAPSPPDLAPLRQPSYRDYLAPMLSALIRSAAQPRPVLLCLRDWRESARLVEALLSLLPPTTRARTTFCTYENEYEWQRSMDDGSSTTRGGGHQLLVLASDLQEGGIELRSSEYQANYFIFNFVENQFSDCGTPDAFAQFAASCVLEQTPGRLTSLHSLIESLNLGRESAAWSELVPAAGLVSPPTGAFSPVDALRPLVRYAQQPEQADVILGVALPALRRSLQAGESAEVTALVGELALLVGRLSGGEEDRRVTWRATVRSLIDEQLGQGKVQHAAALLALAGEERKQMALDLITDMLANTAATPVTPPAASADREALVRLLVDGLRWLKELATDRPASDQLLVTLFEAARQAGMTAEIWSQVCESEVKPLLEPTVPASGSLLAKLLKLVAAKDCPEGYIWLTRRQLETKAPQGEELIDTLVNLASAAALTPQSELTDALPQMVDQYLPDAGRRVVTLGRMAEAAHGSSISRTLFVRYRQLLNDQQPKAIREIRQELARCGCLKVLYRELSEDLDVPEESAIREKLIQWRNDLFTTCPALYDKTCGETATRLQGSARVPHVQALAWQLLSTRPQANTAAQPGAGLLDLYQTVIDTLPLAPLAPKHLSLLSDLPSGLARTSAHRAKVLMFMSEVQRRAKPEWSFGDFPYNDGAWRQSAHDLHAVDKDVLLDWCIRLCQNTGLKKPEHAEALLNIYRGIGCDRPDDIARGVEKLLRGRDLVTHVNAAMAFAVDASDNPKGSPLLQAIVSQFPKPIREQFYQHLRNRFNGGVTNYSRQIEELIRQIEPNAATRTQPITPPREERSGASVRHGGGDLFSNLKQWVDGLLNKQGPEDNNSNDPGDQKKR